MFSLLLTGRCRGLEGLAVPQGVGAGSPRDRHPEDDPQRDRDDRVPELHLSHRLSFPFTQLTITCDAFLIPAPYPAAKSRLVE